MAEQAQEVKRERGRGRLYKQAGSQFYWMAFYKHGKEFRMSTGETDETAALRALKRRVSDAIFARLQADARQATSPR